MQRRGLLLATLGAIATAFAPAVATATSAIDKVNVNRLIAKIKKDMLTQCEYFLFEPNDELTRSEIKRTLSEYLEDLRKRKNIYDYAVVTDSSTVEKVHIDVAVRRHRDDNFIYLPITISQQPVLF